MHFQFASILQNEQPNQCICIEKKLKLGLQYGSTLKIFCRCLYTMKHDNRKNTCGIKNVFKTKMKK